jgi:hypothetical protein
MTNIPSSPVAPVGSPVPQPKPSRPYGPGRIIVLVAGILAVLVGLPAVIGGAVMLAADRNRDGAYLTSGAGRLSTETYAISAPQIHIRGSGPDYFYGNALLGEVRLQVQPAGGGDVFVGVGPAAQVDAYLAQVARDQFKDLELDPFTVTYTRHAGGRPAAAPTAQSFWVAQDSGAGRRTLTWKPGDGDWTTVVMNADGSANVQADITAGATLPVIRIAGITTLVIGILLLLGGLILIGLAVATRRRRPSPMVSGGHPIETGRSS